MHTDVLVSLVQAGGAIVTVLVSSVAAILAGRANHNAKKGRENAADASHSARVASHNSFQSAEHSHEARKQVQNSHTTNLRDDVDTLADKLDRLGEDVNAGLEALWLALRGNPPTGSVKLPEGHQ